MITRSNRTTSALKLYSVVENYSQGIHGYDHNDANINFNVFSTSQRLTAQRLKEMICSLSVCFIKFSKAKHDTKCADISHLHILLDH